MPPCAIWRLLLYPKHCINFWWYRRPIKVFDFNSINIMLWFASQCQSEVHYAQWQLLHHQATTRVSFFGLTLPEQGGVGFWNISYNKNSDTHSTYLVWILCFFGFADVSLDVYRVPEHDPGVIGLWLQPPDLPPTEETQCLLQICKDLHQIVEFICPQLSNNCMNGMVP